MTQYTKAILMPLLLLYLYVHSKGNVKITTLLLATALILSWGGDVALIFQADQLYFLLGVGLFLCAQLVYMYLFTKAVYGRMEFDPLRSLPFILYAILLLFILIPASGEFMIAVGLYGVCLTAMAIASRLRGGLTGTLSFQMVLLGAILFMLSDSLLAINKFLTDLPLAHLWIMGTYIPAQLFISKGILAHDN